MPMENSYAQESFEVGNLLDEYQKNMANSSMGNSQFLRTHHDMLSLLERNHHLYDEPDATGKSIDPRILMLLAYFRELYLRKGELFRKTFPGIHDEFAEFFKKIGDQVVSPLKSHKQTRDVKTMQRSLSVGSPRRGDASPLRLERFKIRTVVLDGVDQGGGQAGGGKGETKSGNSK